MPPPPIHCSVFGQSVGESPIDKTKIGVKRYAENKMRQIKGWIRKRLELEPVRLPGNKGAAKTSVASSKNFRYSELDRNWLYST